MCRLPLLQSRVRQRKGDPMSSLFSFPMHPCWSAHDRWKRAMAVFPRAGGSEARLASVMIESRDQPRLGMSAGEVYVRVSVECSMARWARRWKRAGSKSPRNQGALRAGGRWRGERGVEEFGTLGSRVVSRSQLATPNKLYVGRRSGPMQGLPDSAKTPCSSFISSIQRGPFALLFLAQRWSGMA